MPRRSSRLDQFVDRTRLLAAMGEQGVPWYLPDHSQQNYNDLRDFSSC